MKKKIIIGIFAVIGVVILGIPFGNGLLMERFVHETVSNLNSLYTNRGHELQIELIRYDRGYTSSEVEWKIKLGGFNAVYGTDEIIFIDKVQHGWRGMISNISMEKNSWYAAAIKENFSGKDPLHITAEYRYFGDINIKIMVDACTVKAKDKVFSVSPANMSIRCDKNLKNFETKAIWAGLELPQHVMINGIDLKSDVNMISPYIWEGDASLILKRTHVEDGADSLDLDNVKIDYALKYNKDNSKLSIKSDYTVENLTFKNEHISNVVAKIALSEIDGKNYEEFMKLYSTVGGAILGDLAEAGKNSEQAKKALEKKMTNAGLQIVAAGEKLLTKGLQFQVSDFQANVPEGQIRADLLINLKKDMTFAQFMPVVNKPALIVDIFNFKAYCSIPEKLLGDAPMLYSPVYRGMQTGFFIKEGKNALHRSEIKDNKLYINEKELVL